MKLASTADSINKIANVGSTENVTRKLFLYQQCNCPIIAIERSTSWNDGKIILLGNADSANDGLLTSGDTIIITSRPINSTNEITLTSQPAYDSDSNVTTIIIPTSSNYLVDGDDIGSFVCKKINVTDRIVEKSPSRISARLEDGFGNSGSSEFSVSLDNTDNYFYDRKNSSGLFYSNSKLTKVKRIIGTDYSDKYNLYVTHLEVDSIHSDSTGTDYIGHHALFYSGNAAGSQSLIIENVIDDEFKIIGHYAKNYVDPVEYNIDLKLNDPLYMNISNVFWFRLEFGILSEPTERKNLICGKLDFSTLGFKDFDTIVNIKGYTFEKEFSDKIVGDIKFNSSSIKGTAINEINNVYYESAYGNSLKESVKEIRRILDTDSAGFMNVDYVAHDVIPGWNIIDVIPNLNLFRFNFGKWTRVRSSLDFESSTQTVFLATLGGEIPDHSSVNGADETKSHKEWIQLSFEIQDASSVGVTNVYTGTGAADVIPQKIIGMPDKPTRFFFRMGEGAGVNKRQVFIGRLGYEFDGGETIYPEIYPNMLFYGSALNSLTSYNNYILNGSVNHPAFMIIGAFEKFNGVLINFEANAAGGLVSEMLSHIGVKYSTGGDLTDSGSWSGNINPRYCGGTVNTVTSQTVLKCVLYNWEKAGTGGAQNFSTDELNDMYLKSVSGLNFNQTRKITDFSVDGSDYADITIEKEFDNSVAVDDQFEIVNKNFNIRFKDFGNSLNSSDYFDCVITHDVGDYNHSGTSAYHDRRKEFFETIDDGDYNSKLELQGEIYLGKNRKFNNIALSFITSANVKSDGRLDLPSIIVDYWDGTRWRKVENLSVYDLDFTDAPNSQTDAIHFICSFDLDGWVKRDMVDIYSGAVNSDVDLYYLRIRTDVPYMRELISCRLFEPSNLFVCLTWNNLQDWSKNYYEDTTVLDYGSLTTMTQSYEHFYVSIEYSSSTFTRVGRIDKILLISKFEGHNADKLFSYFDMLSTEHENATDYIQFNDKDKTNMNVVPRISTDKYLINNFGKTIGFDKRLVSIQNYVKNKIDVDNKNVNIIGNFKNPVKMIPAKLNWDSAKYFYKENPQHEVWANIVCSCVIKDRGVYRLFLLRDTAGGTLYQYTSQTGFKDTWSAVAGSLAPRNNYSNNIDWISVVKNSESDEFHIFLVGSDGETANRVYHVTFTSFGSFTDENSGNAVLSEDSGWEATEIVDCCVAWNGGEYSSDKWEMYYTANDGSTNQIGYADSTDGDSWSKYGSNPVISNGSSDSWDESGVRSPAILKTRIYYGSNNLGYNFASIYYIGKDSSNDERIGLAIQNRGTAGARDIEKYPDDKSPVYDHVIANLKSLCYTYEGYLSYMLPESYDFFKFYYATVSKLVEFRTADGRAFPQIDETNKEVNLSREYKDEFACFDSFVSDQVSLDFDTTDDQHLMLGFREKFNTVDLVASNETNEKFHIEYWDGDEWQNLTVQQFGSASHLVENKTGFVFDEPVDWQPIDVSSLLGDEEGGAGGLGTYTDSELRKIFMVESWPCRVLPVANSTINKNDRHILAGVAPSTDDESNDIQYLKKETTALYWIRIKSYSSNTGTVSLKRASLAKGVYLIADKNNVWILKDDGFLEHKLCATRLISDSNFRYEIMDISYDSINNNVMLTLGFSKYYGYNIFPSGLAATNVQRVYKFNIFDKVNIIPEIGYFQNRKDNRYIYRKGKEIQNDNLKYIHVIGKFSDQYVDDLDNNS